ncbi:glycerophosphodiester phosphodiesterase [Sterolibacterium denitrificans]|nr:glycerophosphodiester phosphodiesterase [Sterolibacterium denitrificans]
MSPSWHYPRIIAHRCGGALAPENSLAGLAVAARLGIRAVEFDVMLSADAVPVLIHDETLERTSNGQGRVADWPYERLRRLDVGRHHHRAFAGERLADLHQALIHCQALGLAANIEIKPAAGHERQTGRVVAEWVSAFQRECAAAGSQTVPLLFSSFSEEALEAARLAADAGAGAGDAPARALLCEEIPADWQTRLQRLDCRYLHGDAHRLQAGRLAEIQAAGVALACYTVNDPVQAEQLFAAGVTAIFSDRIDLFAATA